MHRRATSYLELASRAASEAWKWSKANAENSSFLYLVPIGTCFCPCYYLHSCWWAVNVRMILQQAFGLTAAVPDPSLQPASLLSGGSAPTCLPSTSTASASEEKLMLGDLKVCKTPLQRLDFVKVLYWPLNTWGIAGDT